ncbi:hypothetical protein Osc7112_5636 [Oscillatoria nigro-viridis PCC 7112]|uniref:Uncharacterized protein n=1 Tax=Phormidium nigroviride PCC 7112 TaxID=179408 RepID=K9VQS3_9CYAN|nr:hypothetical protein Osc7112_5636 [Oscillatoria nigro-viridis PCC 7112]
MVAKRKVGATQRVICCNIFIILYADHRIVSQVYLEEYESKGYSMKSAFLNGQNEDNI